MATEAKQTFSVEPQCGCHTLLRPYVVSGPFTQHTPPPSVCVFSHNIWYSKHTACPHGNTQSTCFRCLPQQPPLCPPLLLRQLMMLLLLALPLSQTPLLAALTLSSACQ